MKDNIFTNEFTKVDKNQILSSLENDGVYSFRNALSESFISNLLEDVKNMIMLHAKVNIIVFPNKQCIKKNKLYNVFGVILISFYSRYNLNFTLSKFWIH